MDSSKNSGFFYKIKFYDACIKTTVTSKAAVVDSWISKIYHIHRFRLHKLLVGLDTEWCLEPKDHQPVAILQLCVGQHCLIFQFFHADDIPQSLVDFLGNQDFMFVGVGVKQDADKLLEDWGLQVSCTMDVARMVAKRYKDPDYKRTGLKMLALEFVGVWMAKPENITLSKWDVQELSYDQVEYACIDAFVSFKLGVKINKLCRNLKTTTRTRIPAHLTS